MATAGTLEYLISVDSSSLSGGLKGAESKVKNFGQRLSAKSVAVGQMIANFTEKAVAATGRFIKGAVQESMSFDKSMAQVAATLGKTTNEVQDLAKFARKMGSETAFTAQEAAEGLNYMALAGYDAEKSMKMLPQVLNLAAAGNFDLARASDMVTDAQSALGLSIEDTEVLIDQMAKAASNSNTSVEQLGDAILTIGGTAKQLKGGTAELAALLGALADNGIKGSEGGTMLRNVLMRLTNPTDKAAKELSALGVSAFDSQGNLRDLTEIFTDFNDATSEMTMQQRASILGEIFNVRDLKGIEALLGTSKERWKELFKEISKAKGAAQQMAKTQLDNLEGDVTKFKSALGETKLAIVEGLTPAFRKWTQAATVGVQRLTKAFKKGGLQGAIKEAKKMFGEAMDVMRNSSSKFLSTIGKVGYLFKDGFKGIKINAAELLGIDDPTNASWSEIGGKVMEKIKGGLGKVKMIAADLLDIDNPETAGWDDIATKIITNLKTRLTSGADFIKGLILGDEATAESTWADVATKLTGYVTKAFESGGLFDIILGQGTDIAVAAVDVASQFVTSIATWLGTDNHATSIITSLTTVITEAVPKLAEAFGKIFSDDGFWDAVINGLADVGEAILDAILGKDITNAIRRFFGVTVPGELSNNIRSSIADIWYEAFNAPQGTKGQAAAQWNDFMKDVFNLSGLDASLFNSFMDQFNFDALSKKFAELTPDEYAGFYEDIATGIENFGGADVKLNPDTKAIEEACAETYDVVANLTAVEGSGLKDENGYDYKPEVDGEVDYEPETTAVDNWQPPNKQADVVYRAVMSGATLGTSEYGGGGGGGTNVMMTQAKGNWMVPYDNYPSLLHRGEMVLTKSQARQYRDGEGGGMDIASAVNSAVTSAMSKVYVMLNGDKVGDLTTRRIKKNINASSYNKLRAMGG